MPTNGKNQHSLDEATNVERELIELLRASGWVVDGAQFYGNAEDSAMVRIPYKKGVVGFVSHGSGFMLATYGERLPDGGVDFEYVVALPNATPAELDTALASLAEREG